MPGTRCESTESTDPFDVAILGAGITGAALFRELVSRGHRVLLIDRADFAAGTSQASGMLAWGGLLYLRNLHLRSVIELSRERDRLIEEVGEPASTARFRYLPLRHGGRPRWMVRLALELYWLLGSCRRARCYGERDFAERALLKAECFGDSLVYEEAALDVSDARLALEWILAAERMGGIARNHCEVQPSRDPGNGWALDLRDHLTGEEHTARASFLVNATGVWADRTAQALGLATHHRHVLSKGVYLGLPRHPAHRDFLGFEMGQHGDSQTFTPWGPIALWGPTETGLERIEDGLEPAVDDVRFLLDQANRNLRDPIHGEDVVSLRCGIRPLAVKRSAHAPGHSLDLSRRHALDLDREARALTIFGGKITSSQATAREAANRIRSLQPPPCATRQSHARTAPAPMWSSPYRNPDGTPLRFVAPEHARNHEHCATLWDYLRRRTEIAQWVPNLGLGRHQEHRDTVRALAITFHGEDGADVALAELTARATAQATLLAKA